MLQAGTGHRSIFGLDLKLSLHPLDLLLRLSPLAFLQCLVYAWYRGELSRLSIDNFSTADLVALAINGCLAFALNVVSFTTNKKIGPAAMAVSGLFFPLHQTQFH